MTRDGSAAVRGRARTALADRPVSWRTRWSAAERSGRVAWRRRDSLPPRPVAGEVREVSIVMADLRGFTAFCEQVPPSGCRASSTSTSAAMVDVILGQQGRVQDFVGDGILGVFGAHSSDPDHAWHATLTALEMQTRHPDARGALVHEEGVAFGLGVAVHSGQVVHRDRWAVPEERNTQWSGDPVNTGGETRGAQPGPGHPDRAERRLRLARVRDRVDVTRRDRCAVRGGRGHPVEVFEFLGCPRRSRASGPDPAAGAGPGARPDPSDELVGNGASRRPLPLPSDGPTRGRTRHATSKGKGVPMTHMPHRWHDPDATAPHRSMRGALDT